MLELGTRAQDQPLLWVDHVTHRLGGAGSTPVLRDVELVLAPGEWVALAGRSGSGKTTLCHLVAGMGTPTAGRILIDSVPADRIEDWAVVSLLPQRLALAEELSVAENLLLPLNLRARHGVGGAGGAGGAGRAGLGEQLIETLGLAGLADRLVGQTSLGEQQRTALGRALALGPRLAVLDEPTGHQDDEHVDRVLAALSLVHERGTAILVATHDERMWRAAGRVLTIHEGQLT
ncbi:ABC transporter ATP-binding protein [Pengzhenrongella sicca]|uniref:ATP-binding cassette domain-containing protein n=1 Tax=Pengzhenrongella sicca TaxID=2819238 RepID=A0A8A4Z817_9MICO|nr:ATP-binding cassette domain-containing protein [Pengzhenrongella sicca]QTE27964.1 ATP-binding cassette domain-containing protein [Pengzhenrongella sicca]